MQPFGDVRNEIHAGIVAATIAAYAGKTLKKGERISIQDFMHVTRRKRNAGQDEVMSQLRRMGAKVSKKRKQKDG